MAFSDNTVLSRGVESLAALLPLSWSTRSRKEVASGNRSLDALIKVTDDDGKSAQVAVEVKQTIEPRQVPVLFAQMRLTDYPPLVMAPYLSPSVRERMLALKLNFLDLTGNVHLELKSPGLFIHTEGASTDPNPKAQRSRSLRGVKAGHIVRALIDSKEPPRVRDLAERIGTDAGYVSRIVALLDREALIERNQEGRITRVDWLRLLRRWAEEAPLSSRGVQTLCLEPRGLKELEAKLLRTNVRYALTGTLAASLYAPLTPPRLAVVYVKRATDALGKLNLKPTEAGANVLIIEPEDNEILTEPRLKNDLHFVSPSQAAVDLLTSPGRGPAEAEGLLTWMTKHEGEWRR